MDTGTSDLALLRAYEPVVRYTEGELFFPVAVGPYVERCSLWARDARDGEERAELLVPAGGLDLDELARVGRGARDRALELRFVAEPLGRRALRHWRREDRPRLRHGGRLAAVGVLARSVDSFLRLSLLLRGRTPGGSAAAAEVASRTHLTDRPCAYHGRVVREGGYTVLQYWLFYVFNDWRSTFSGVNDHEGDWELIAVYLADGPDGPVPAWVAASSHDHVGDELRRRWDDPLLQRHGDHPVVHAGAGSHAHAFVAGDVVISVELPALRRVVDAVARTWRRLAPWSRAAPSSDAFALPFIDYARGDGRVVGPGGPDGWDAHPIADGTPWVQDYRGLWGLDTQDVFGGERAPAGPRYERGGTVRRSWADPLGWAGLQEVPPCGAEHLRDAAAALADRVTRLDEEIDAERSALRDLAARVDSLTGVRDLAAVRAARSAELRRRERELAATTAERAQVADELAVHRRRLVEARPPDPPDAHLRVRAPAPRHVRRPRVLAVWGVVSTPLLALTVVVLLTAPPLAFLTSFAVFVALFVGVEAAARGRLLAFLVGLALTCLAAAVATTLVVGLVQNWRAVLAVLLTLAAVVLLAVNVRDLRRR